MLYGAAVFLIIPIVAGVLGFGGIAGAASSVAQILFFHLSRHLPDNPGWRDITLRTTIGTASVNVHLPFKTSIYQHGDRQ